MLAPKDGKGPASDSPSQQLRLSTRRAPHAETPGPRGAGASLPDPTAGAGLRLSRQTSRTGPSGVSLWCLRASGGGLGPLQSAAGRVASVEAVCQAGVPGHPLPPTGLWPRAGVAITPRSPPTAGAQRVGGLGGDRGPGGPGPALTPVTPARRPFHPWGRGVPDSAELLRKTYSDLLSL